MKRLFIIRHAKSAHGLRYKSDFERPLNERGKRDVRLMAAVLREEIDGLDCLLVSAAKRTRETAAGFIREFSVEEKQVKYLKSLYLPGEDEIWNKLRNVDPDCKRVAVFTHNPAVEYLLHRYRPGTACPTCSILELQYSGVDWASISPSNVRFISHKYPKQYV